MRFVHQNGDAYGDREDRARACSKLGQEIVVQYHLLDNTFPKVRDFVHIYSELLLFNAKSITCQKSSNFQWQKPHPRTCSKELQKIKSPYAISRIEKGSIERMERKRYFSKLVV